MNGCIIQHPETKKYAFYDVSKDLFTTEWLTESELAEWQAAECIKSGRTGPFAISKYMTFDHCIELIRNRYGDKKAQEVINKGRQ